METHLKSRAELYKILPLKPVIAEIGTASGLFARDMANWGASKLYVVDMWKHIPNFSGDGGYDQEWHDKNLENATKLLKPFPVTFLRGDSAQMAVNVPDASLDLLYLDACHAFECVMADLKAWVPKVKKGGIVAGHDYSNSDYGVMPAVSEFFIKNGYKVNYIPENGADDGFWVQL